MPKTVQIPTIIGAMTHEELSRVISDHAEITWNGARPTKDQVETTRAVSESALRNAESQIKQKMDDAINAEIARLATEHELTKNDGLIRIIGGLRKAQGLLPNL